jgi:hypothetical protein
LALHSLSAPSLDNEAWLHEHDGAFDGPAGFLPTPEAVLSGLLMVWGVVLLFVFGYQLVAGTWIFPRTAGLFGWWVASLGLSAAGSWLAFQLANELGFDVREERALPGDFPVA